MQSTMTYTAELVVETCWCGTVHAVPKALRDKMKRDHDDGRPQQGIYCPLGHVWEFSGKGRAQTESERAERLAASLSATRDQLRAEERSHAATRGQLTKARKRADRGVCLHCNRSFVNVERHVATKHPDKLSEGA